MSFVGVPQKRVRGNRISVETTTAAVSWEPGKSESFVQEGDGIVMRKTTDERVSTEAYGVQSGRSYLHVNFSSLHACSKPQFYFGKSTIRRQRMRKQLGRSCGRGDAGRSRALAAAARFLVVLQK